VDSSDTDSDTMLTDLARGPGPDPG
jgi:hypothetical protein